MSLVFGDQGPRRPLLSTETVNALTDLVRALTRLAEVLGAGNLSIILLILGVVFVGFPWLREHQRNRRVDIVIQHKEQEVLRLSEDNRRYREVYLAKLGFPAETLEADSRDSKAAKAEGAQPPKGKKS